MKGSSHLNQGFEKKRLKVDNPKDVARKRLEERFRSKKRMERFRSLALNPAFLDYMYELLELAGYFNSGEGPANSNVYEKKGRLQLGNKIADDLTFHTDEGMVQIVELRKKIRSAEANVKLDEQE